MNYPDQAEQYEIIIYYAKKDGYYVAEVPELPGCAVDAPTREGALAAAKEEIADWISDAQEAGAELPEPKGRVPFAVE